jgi:hypothetical protein
VYVNCWNGVVNNVKTSVAAGVEAENPEQGILVVFAGGQTSYLPTPERAGPVRILAAENGLLTVVSTNDSCVFTFSAGTRAFTATSSVSSAPTSSECNGVFNGDFKDKLTIDDHQTCAFVGGSINSPAMPVWRLSISASKPGSRSRVWKVGR